MKHLKQVLDSMRKKNQTFKEKVVKDEKKIKLKFSSEWYGWGYGGGGD
jgi:hypothetical protein